MEKHQSPRGHQQATLSTAVTASAATLALFGLLEPGALQAQDSEAPIVVPAGNQFSDHQALDKFFDYGLLYADARVLASFWGGDTYEAKLQMGHKLLSFGPETGEISLATARGEAIKNAPQEMPCSYYDAGYNYEDAEALAAYWGKGLVESKLTMNRLINSGLHDVLNLALETARGL